MPFKAKKAFDEEIENLLKLWIICESVSQYVSPDFPIMKKNGTIRLVVDYREINKVSIPDSFLFPDLHQEIRSILKSKYFSQIDLLKRYHQIRLKREA